MGIYGNSHGVSAAHRAYHASQRKMEVMPAQKIVAEPATADKKAPPVTMADLERLLDDREAAAQRQQAEIQRQEAEQASIRQQQLAAAAQIAAAADPPALNTLTTSQKLARGLSESASARSTITNSAEPSEAVLARQKRFELSDQGRARASLKIHQGLNESDPARPPTRPAA